MKMTLYHKSDEQMKDNNSRYRYILYSQRFPSVHWKAFTHREEFDKWLSIYKGSIETVKPSGDIVFHVPEIHRVHQVPQEDLNNIWNLEDLYKYQGISFFVPDYFDIVFVEDGLTTLNGGEINCRRLFMKPKKSNEITHVLVMNSAYKKTYVNGHVELEYV